MKFDIQSGNYKDQAFDCLIMGVFEGGELTPSLKSLDQECENYVSKFLTKSDFQGKIGDTQVLYYLPHLQIERVMLVGCGKNTALTERDFRKIVTSSMKTLNASKVKKALTFLTEVPVEKRDLDWKMKQIVLVSEEAFYSFDQFKTEKTPRPPLETLALFVNENQDKFKKLLDESVIIAKGAEYTKNLANLPSNICNPSYLAEQAKQLAKDHKNLKITVLEERDMEKLGMGAFLGVAKGSDTDAKLICLEYHGGNKEKSPYAFVGKGITFDTGGISLKPADSMIGMKYDMCGAATVLGVMKAAAELKLPINIVGLLACAENMPSGKAYKPEDIVTTLSGQTVEVMNTDAEGRLVLCDALTYCDRFHPKVVIDIATLTGSVVIGLGIHATGLFSNNETLAQNLLKAGNEVYDRAWQMPLWEEYQEQLKSPFADMSNTGGRAGGVITAACFLSRFTKKYTWAHLDVAGTAAMMGGTDRYATGRPVPMLVQYLINQSQAEG